MDRFGHFFGRPTGGLQDDDVMDIDQEDGMAAMLAEHFGGDSQVERVLDSGYLQNLLEDDDFDDDDI